MRLLIVAALAAALALPAAAQQRQAPRGDGADHPLVVTAPCDSPFLPADLVERLAAALHAADAQLAVAKTFDQPHPVFCLCRRDLAGHLGDFLASGGRKRKLLHGVGKALDQVTKDVIVLLVGEAVEEEPAARRPRLRAIRGRRR